MKLTGAVLLLACGTLTGFLQAQKIRQKRLICRELAALCNALLSAISYRSDSVVSLLDKLLTQPDYRRLTFLSSAQIKQRQPVMSPLKREENETLSAFLYSLGKSDLSSQQRAVKCFYDYITQCEADYAERYRHDAGLFVCFGFFGTALLALILL